MDSFPTCSSGGWEEEQPHFEKPAWDFLGESQVSVRERMGLSREEFGIKGIWLMKGPESVMEGLWKDGRWSEIGCFTWLHGGKCPGDE